MPLRIQKGNRTPWQLEEIQAGFEQFFLENNHYPTTPEIDAYPYLPSSRAIEYSFGGVVSLRRQLGIGGQDDYRSGAHSSDRALTIGKRAHKNESDVYTYLCKRFHKELVHREYLFSEETRSRADFFIYDQNGNFCVDAFFASDKRSLVGCINSKLLKYECTRDQPYPVIFLQMNPDLTQDILDLFIQTKDKKLAGNQSLMSWDAFRRFCDNREALTFA
ncbi:MAG: hypothetical protein JWN64_730 [Parcubacteria group bacterium]|nr:hypothetical protein [Parcubacteria group bacterium]